MFNEVFGLAFDIGTKPISETELKRLCVLGPMGRESMTLAMSRARNYIHYTMGVDWGVNAITSRTVATLMGTT